MSNTGLTPRLAVASLLLALAASVQAAGESYCCPDPSTGRRVCGDTLPDACRGRAYRVLDSGGNVIKEVGPPLTAEQKAAAAAEAQRRKQVEEANREQRRRDQALLDTYTSLEDIDFVQHKVTADTNLAIQSIAGRLETLRGKRKTMENEAEFYKKKTLPPNLDKELRAIDHEIGLQQDLLDLKNRELDSIQAKYDAERKRFLELTRRPAAGGAAPAPR